MAGICAKIIFPVKSFLINGPELTEQQRATNWSRVNLGVRVICLFIFFGIATTTLLAASPIIFSILTILEICESGLAYFLVMAVREKNAGKCKVWGVGEIVFVILYSLILIWAITSFDFVFGVLFYFIFYAVFRVVHLRFVHFYVNSGCSDSPITTGV